MGDYTGYWSGSTLQATSSTGSKMCGSNDTFVCGISFPSTFSTLSLSCDPLKSMRPTKKHLIFGSVTWSHRSKDATKSISVLKTLPFETLILSSADGGLPTLLLHTSPNGILPHPKNGEILIHFWSLPIPCSSLCWKQGAAARLSGYQQDRLVQRPRSH